jgi:hypothetical protein
MPYTGTGSAHGCSATAPRKPTQAARSGAASAYVRWANTAPATSGWPISSRARGPPCTSPGRKYRGGGAAMAGGEGGGGPAVEATRRGRMVRRGGTGGAAARRLLPAHRAGRQQQPRQTGGAPGRGRRPCGRRAAAGRRRQLEASATGGVPRRCGPVVAKVAMPNEPGRWARCDVTCCGVGGVPRRAARGRQRVGGGQWR